MSEEKPVTENGSVRREVFNARNDLRRLLEAFVQEISDDDDHELLENFRRFERTCREYKC